MSSINRKFPEEVRSLEECHTKCARGMRKSGADGGDLSGMNVFQIFSFTIFLLHYFIFIFLFFH